MKVGSARNAAALSALMLAAALLGGCSGAVETQPDGAPTTPADADGWTRLTLAPVLEGDEQVSSRTVADAIDIIQTRIDSFGIPGALVTRDGANSIIVTLPGTPDQVIIDLLSKPALLEFRPVLTVTNPAPITDIDGDGLPDPEPTVSAEGLSDTPATQPTSPSDFAWITPAVQRRLFTLDCTDPANRTGDGDEDPTKAVVTCSADGTAKYVLGPVEIQGQEIANASAGPRTTPTGATGDEAIVTLEFTPAGTSAFSDATTRLVTLNSPLDQFAIVVDGLVISAPAVDGPIVNGVAEISGTFTRESAKALAAQLNSGAMPLTFLVQNEQVSTIPTK